VPHVGGPILPPCHSTTVIGMLLTDRVGDMLTCTGPPKKIRGCGNRVGRQ